jgi:3-deoxy-D-manno-octulosonate 8-phosphate phosphatase KdsC-like HAD superfamily phosphatase
MANNEIVAIFDVDGTLASPQMFYTEKGKVMKAFSADDKDALLRLDEKVEVVFISADTRGFPITQKRVISDMGFELHNVSHEGKKRWDWIKANFPTETIVYIADGIFDGFVLNKASFSLCPQDSLEEVKVKAKATIPRNGGDRCVAKACLMIDEKFKLGCFGDL